MTGFPFYVEDLTVNDANLAIGSAKQFDIRMGSDWAKIRSAKLVQLITGPMNITFEIWEKDENGYDYTDRSTFHLRVLRRSFVQTEQQGAEIHEILEPMLLYFDRDKTGEIHCRLTNNFGGTASDFALVLKCAEIGESI